MVDLQNASLAGGVIVGAVSDLVLQPYGAIIAGSIAGAVATFGYQILQVKLAHIHRIKVCSAGKEAVLHSIDIFQTSLLDTLNLHDSCGVNNLHGMPGILGGCLSALIALTATAGNYGDR